MEFKSNTRAIFLQIADYLADKILASSLPPESRIPSVRSLAAELEVNANTVMRAYEHLTENGIIENKRGIGYFITIDATERIRDERKMRFMGDYLHEIFRQLKLLNVSPQELMSKYQSFLSKQP